MTVLPIGAKNKMFLLFKMAKSMKTPTLLLLITTLSLPTHSLANPQPPVYVKQGVSFNRLAEQCGRDVHPDTLQAVARVESRFNPYAIGVVKGALKRQPETYEQAVAAAKMLHAQGRNFSMGLMQVNRHNLKAYGLDYETVFHPCKNIQAGAAILTDCFKRAGGRSQEHLQKAFSCYYSGNFRTGFRADFKGQPPYVVKILRAARDNTLNQLLAYNVPAVNPNQTVSTLSKPATTAMPTPARAALVSGHPKSQTVSVGADNDVPFQAQTIVGHAPQPERKREAWDVFGEF